MKSLQELKQKYSELDTKKNKLVAEYEKIKDILFQYEKVYKPEIDKLDNEIKSLYNEMSAISNAINHYVEENIKEVSVTVDSVLFEWDKKILKEHSWENDNQHLTSEAFDRLLNHIIDLSERRGLGRVGLGGKPVFIYISGYGLSHKWQQIYNVTAVTKHLALYKDTPIATTSTIPYNQIKVLY